MNRRAYLTKMLGKKPQQKVPLQPTPITLPSAPTASLEPFSGEWTYETAAHLLRRASFGPTVEQIKEAVELGLEGTLELLLADRPLPAPPLNFDYPDDPYVAVGESWVDSVYFEDEDIDTMRYRKESLKAWTIMQLLDEGTSLREKMALFWSNHFGVSDQIVDDPIYMYRYNTLLRAYAWGNFKALVQHVTIEPAMLRFLNGNQNTKNAPNENYARELLELFTVGKGPLAAPEDYTTFTELDVLEISKILTGWDDNGYRNKDPEQQIEVVFNAEDHDESGKQLSHRFQNAIINNEGEAEYKTLIDVIFQQEATALHICRKLYRWFVYYVIDEDTETQLIQPLAQVLIDNDFEIKPVLETLLKSQYFYDILNVGPMIKNPIDFTVSAIKQTYASITQENISQLYFLLNKVYGQTRVMQMAYHAPPEVAGWDAYYKAPAYYRLWINATTLRTRFTFTDRISSERGMNFLEMAIISDPFRMMENIDVDASKDPNILIREFSRMLHPKPLFEAQYAALKEILIPGLPDFEWTLEYSTYLENPEDPTIAKSIENKLRLLLRVMLSMEEFQLS